MSRKRASEAGVVLHRPRSLRSDEIELVEGLPVTSVPRTLIDLCAVVRPQAVELALESALRKGLASVAQIEAELARAGSTRPGRGVLRSLLDQLPDASTESALETLVWELLREGGVVPLPVRQHEVRDERGKFVARVDFAYPDHRIAIEADGHRFHTSKKDWTRDLVRQNALTRLGWTVYRVTWDDVTQRSRKVVSEITELLEQPTR